MPLTTGKTLRDYGLEFEAKKKQTGNADSAAKAALRSYGLAFEQEKAAAREKVAAQEDYGSVGGVKLLKYELPYDVSTETKKQTAAVQAVDTLGRAELYQQKKTQEKQKTAAPDYKQTAAVQAEDALGRAELHQQQKTQEKQKVAALGYTVDNVGQRLNRLNSLANKADLTDDEKLELQAGYDATKALLKKLSQNSTDDSDTWRQVADLQSRIQGRLHPTGLSAFYGFANGTGVLPAAKALTSATGETGKQVAQQTTEMQQLASHDAPVAEKVGSTIGYMALLSNVGAGVERSAALSGLGSAAKSGITFAATSAMQSAANQDWENGKTGDNVVNVMKDSVIGGIVGLVGAPISQKIGSAVLSKLLGMGMSKTAALTLSSAGGGLAFGIAAASTQEAAKAAEAAARGETYKPDAGEIAKNIIATAVYSALSTLAKASFTMRGTETKLTYFTEEDMKSPDTLRQKRRFLANQMRNHPDVGGSEEVMKQINAEFEVAKASMAARYKTAIEQEAQAADKAGTVMQESGSVKDALALLSLDPTENITAGGMAVQAAAQLPAKTETAASTGPELLPYELPYNIAEAQAEVEALRAQSAKNEAARVAQSQAVESTGETPTAAEKAEMKQDQRSLVQKLVENIPTVQDMQPVKSLTGKELYGGGGSLVDKVSAFFDRIGNKVTRNGFGDINLKRRGVKSSIAHGTGRAKAVSFEAVPEVLQYGQQIDYQPNWKGRGSDSYVFAAPATINGEKVYVAAVVLKDKANNFYLHEVVDTNGNMITMDNDLPGVYPILSELKQNEGGTDLFKTGVTVKNGVTGKSESPSENSIPNFQQKSNSPVPQNVSTESAATGPALLPYELPYNIKEEETALAALQAENDRKAAAAMEARKAAQEEKPMDLLAEVARVREEAKQVEEGKLAPKGLEAELNARDAQAEETADETYLRSLEENMPGTGQDNQDDAELQDYLLKDAEAEEKRREKEAAKAAAEQKEDGLKNVLKKISGSAYEGEDPTTIPEIADSTSELDGTESEDQRDYSYSDMLSSQGVGYGKDLSRNLDAAAGKSKTLREILRERFEKPIWKAKADYAREVETHLDGLMEKAKSLGIREGTKESAAVQWYGEGYYTDQYGDTHDYALKDLQRDFPESWQKIVQMEQYCRKVYDEYIDRMNATLENIYPRAMENAMNEQAKYHARQTLFRQQAARETALEQEIRERIIRKTETAEGKRDGTAIKAQLLNSIDRDARLAEAAASRAQKYTEQAQHAASIEKSIAADIESGEVLRNKRLTPRKDYFHHFQEVEKGWQGLVNLVSTPADIDARLAGLSEYTQPKTRFAGFLQRRQGGAYTADAVGGLKQYVLAAEYKVNIDPIIADFRAQIRGMAEATKDTRNANGFLVWLTDYTNDLAGKTNFIDRVAQKLVSRKGIAALRWLNSRVKSNAVIGNFRSAVAQVFNIPNAAAYVKNPADWIKGGQLFTQQMVGRPDAKAVLEQSGFLQERYLDSAVRQFDEGILKAPEKFANWMMSVGDEQATKLIWCAAYEQAARNGENNPIMAADDITRRSVAGRGIGEVPLVQKSQIVQLIAPFQIEVNNQYQLLKEKIGEKDALAVLLMWLVGYLMNGATRKLFGFDVAADPINAVVESVEGWDEDASTWEKAAALTGRVGGEMLSGAPFGTQIAQNLISDDTLREKIMGDSDPTRFGTGNIGLNMLTRPITKAVAGEDFSNDAMSAVLNIGLPFGGKQTERIIEGLQDMGTLPRISLSTKTGLDVQEQTGGASYTDSGKLRFPIDTTDAGNVASDLLFGPFSTKEGREYIENGRSPLSEKITQAYEDMTSIGISGQEFITYYRDTKDLKSDKDTEGKIIKSASSKKLDYIDGMNLTAEQKGQLYRYTVATEDMQEKINVARSGAQMADIYKAIFALKDIGGEGAKVKKIQALDGLGFDDEKAAVIYKALLASDKTEGEGKLFAEGKAAGLTDAEVYRYLADTSGIEADKDADGDSVAGSMDEKRVQAIDRMGIGDEKAAALYYVTATEAKQAAYDALKQAGMSAGDIFSLQADGYALQTSLTQQTAAAKGQGIDLKTVYKAAAEIAGMEADRDSLGRAISGSKQDKVGAYIDGLDLTKKQKDWMYTEIGGYVGTVAAPWNLLPYEIPYRVDLPKITLPTFDLPTFDLP